MRRILKEGKPIEKPADAKLKDLDCIFYLKDFPQNKDELELV